MNGKDIFNFTYMSQEDGGAKTDNQKYLPSFSPF